jgi:murein L,D-transpeptidase YafK
MKHPLPVFLLLLCLHGCAQAQPKPVPAAQTAALKDTLLPQLKNLLAPVHCTPGSPVLLRVFKHEKIVELWMQRNNQLVKARTFPICAASGDPGPKRRQGDNQVPEGFYRVSRFNPESNYHLSFKINYPNAADRHFADPRKPGGDIYFHGDCVSVGCVAIRNKPIEQLFTLVLLAFEKGQNNIPVHIYPCKMTAENMAFLRKKHPQHSTFWYNLQFFYDYFEKKPHLFEPAVDKDGFYVLPD